MVFADRQQAGRSLAGRLQAFRQRPDVLVLALPRGGVPVGYEIARALHVTLDVFLVRKLGVPDQPELAMGAIASGGVRLVNKEVVAAAGISAEDFESVLGVEQGELRRREELYRDGRPEPVLRGRTVILVDDGLATGSSMLAAISALRRREVGSLTIAVPVAPPDTVAKLQTLVDRLVCLETPEPFGSVGRWYADFSQTTDEEVRELLNKATRARTVA